MTRVSSLPGDSRKTQSTWPFPIRPGQSVWLLSDWNASRSNGHQIVHVMMFRCLARSSFTDEAVEASCIHWRSTAALLRGTHSFRPNRTNRGRKWRGAYSQSHCGAKDARNVTLGYGELKLNCTKFLSAKTPERTQRAVSVAESGTVPKAS